MADPIVAILLLFVVIFSVFFLVIYGVLTLVERRKQQKSLPEEAEPGEAPRMDLSKQTAFAQAPSTKLCSKCGTRIPRIADYCPECGTQQIPA
ncbi:MAG: zinc-ribbon domain-containing protein [Nitrososphaerales archaeon]